MRTSVGFIAAAALGLWAASGAHAQTTLSPFAASPGVNFNPFAASTKGVSVNPFAGTVTPTPPSGASQATFPSPGQTLSGPGRLMNLLPSLHGMSNTHYIGYSIFPTQTDQYLAQFGYQKLH